ncbi:MAG: biopolymer transporter ExbD [Candidatus Accumulibacter sp.]|jgi:biopolymer transport protein ExbD|nr:biopolymer transporter ExbD [Accumulibacter sp.]
MAMGQFSASGGSGPTAEINMTPLVDVMLVLLIIFIITAPLMTHSVDVELPRATSSPSKENAPTLQVSITLEGAATVNGERVDISTMEARFREAIARNPKTEMHLMADRDARYGAVAETMSAAHRAGLTRIGFITQPAENDAAPAK